MKRMKEKILETLIFISVVLTGIALWLMKEAW